MNGIKAAALTDSGCTTILSPRLARGYDGSRIAIKALDGIEVKCRGTRQVEIKSGGMRLTTKVIIVERIIIGIDLICELRGLTVKKCRSLVRRDTLCCSCPKAKLLRN